MIAPINLWPDEAEDLVWAAREADFHCKRMGLTPGWEHRQAAMIRVWEIQLKTRLSGKKLRTRSRIQLKYAMIDAIRNFFGRIGSKQAKAYAENWTPDILLASVASKRERPQFDEVANKEIVKRILARSTPRQRIVIDMLMHGHVLREIGLACGRSEAWASLQLKDLRDRAGDLVAEERRRHGATTCGQKPK